MQIQIRKGVFETNSSSTHTLVIASNEEYEKWQKGELYFDAFNEKFFDTEINDYTAMRIMAAGMKIMNIIIQLKAETR